MEAIFEAIIEHVKNVIKTGAHEEIGGMALRKLKGISSSRWGHRWK